MRATDCQHEMTGNPINIESIRSTSGSRHKRDRPELAIPRSDETPEWPARTMILQMSIPVRRTLRRAPGRKWVMNGVNGSSSVPSRRIDVVAPENQVVVAAGQRVSLTALDLNRASEPGRGSISNRSASNHTQFGTGLMMGSRSNIRPLQPGLWPLRRFHFTSLGPRQAEVGNSFKFVNELRAEHQARLPSVDPGRPRGNRGKE